MKKWKRITSSFFAAMILCSFTASPVQASNAMNACVAGQYQTFDCGNQFSGQVLVIKEDNSLWAWGHNHRGQVGDGTKEDRTTPVKIMDDVVTVRAGNSTSAAIKSDGSLWVWGNREKLGRLVKLGAETDVSSLLTSHNDSIFKSDFLTPFRVMGNVQDISIGDDSIVVVKKDGSVYTYGLSTNLGIGISEYTSGEQVGKTWVDNIVAVNSNAKGNMALKNDGSLWYWGHSNEREFLEHMKTGFVEWGESAIGLRENEGYYTYGVFPSPVKMMDNVLAFSSSDGFYQYNVLKTDGKLYTWGNGKPRLNENCNIPVVVAEDVKTFSGKFYVKNDGTLWGRGVCRYGQLANGTTEGDYMDINETYQLSYTQCMSDVEAVSTNGETTFVLKKDGTLWAAGLAENGIIGNGTNGDTIYRGIEEKGIQVKPVKIMDNVKLPSKNLIPQTAFPTSSKVLVNGKEVAFAAYTINGSSYFNMRDIAKAIKGTEKQFQITWDSTKKAVNLLSNQSYTETGKEFAPGDGNNKTATPNQSKIYLDGNEIDLTAYIINGNNYFKLRDFGQVLDFHVGWDGANNTITIDTK